MGAVTDYTFLGSKITADGECSHEIKRHLLLGRKAMINLDSVLKIKDIAKKGSYSQSYGLSSSHVWMWELDHKEGWVPKKWCLWIVVLEKTVKSPLVYKEIKLVILKEINLEYSLELMLKLKLQSFGHLVWRAASKYVYYQGWNRADSLEKTLMLGKIEGKTKREQQRRRWLDGITNSKGMNVSKLLDMVKDREA